MSEEVPRNPAFYHPSTHAGQQRKHRGIEWGQVSQTITDGRVKNSHKEDCKLFVREFENTTKPVGVVANVENGHILTIEWRG